MSLLKLKMPGWNEPKLVKYVSKYADFLYLTYFDGYDPATKTDYPKIGNPVVYSTYRDFVPEIVSRPYGTSNMPFLGNSTEAEGNLWGGQVFSLSDIGDTVSCEWVELYPRGGSSSWGMPGGFNVFNSSNTNCAAFHGCLTNVVGMELSDGNLTLNRWSAERNYYSASSYTGYYLYYYPFNYASFINTNIHIAVVFNFADGLGKVYYNGNLVIIHNFSSMDSISYLRIDPGYWAYGNQAYRTQFCVRRGDHSTNDGENYPVPTEPYWKFA